MKKPSRPLSFLSLLPLPLVAGWFITAEPPRHEAALVAVPAPYVSQFPAPQVDDSKPPVEPAPTF